MTENKEILKNLIWNDSDKLLLNQNSDSNDWDQNYTSRVVHLRYRFYAVWVLVLILLVIFKLLLPWLDKLKAEKANIENAKLELANIEAREYAYQNNKWLVEDIQSYENKLIYCVNREEWCLELPEDIQKDFAIARSYILTYDLNDKKMDVDERKIIENIDAILLKSDFLSNNSLTNWTITKISIWDKTLDGWLYKVPVELHITFENKEALLSFINNVERYVPEDNTMRILYKIDKITYDIVNSDESQDTVIYMNLFYYEEENSNENTETTEEE